MKHEKVPHIFQRALFEEKKDQGDFLVFQAQYTKMTDRYILDYLWGRCFRNCCIAK